MSWGWGQGGYRTPAGYPPQWVDGGGAVNMRYTPRALSWGGGARAMGWLIAGGVVALVLGGVVALSAYMAHAITRPRPVGQVAGARLGSLVEDVAFRAADGVALHGWYFGHPAPKAAITLGHGFGATRADLLDLARALRDRGYAVLAFDFRAHGGSAGRRSTIGFHEARDVVAAARYLAGRPELAGRRIGALGLSMGAAATLIAAAEEPLIAAVVADSGFATLGTIVAGGLRLLYRLPAFPFGPLIVRFGEALTGARIGEHRPIAHVARIAPRPLLIIHGADDALTPVEHARRLYAAAREPKELWIVPETGHCAAYFTDREPYVARVAGFFARGLGATT